MNNQTQNAPGSVFCYGITGFNIGLAAQIIIALIICANTNTQSPAGTHCLIEIAAYALPLLGATRAATNAFANPLPWLDHPLMLLLNLLMTGVLGIASLLILLFTSLAGRSIYFPC